MVYFILSFQNFPIQPKMCFRDMQIEKKEKYIKPSYNKNHNTKFLFSFGHAEKS